jgi:hypothetical protein
MGKIKQPLLEKLSIEKCNLGSEGVKHLSKGTLA